MQEKSTTRTARHPRQAPVRRRHGGTGATALTALLVAVLTAAPPLFLARARGDDGRERGDVPGWVMITLMSAVLVAALLAIAAPALQGLFEQAMRQVQPGR